MPVTERVARLREQSLQTLVTLSTERADLLTEFYRQDLGPVSAPVRRARAFRYLMAHQTIYIGDGELIVGEKGPFPKVAPPTPNSAATLWRAWIFSIRGKRFSTPSARRPAGSTKRSSSPSGAANPCATSSSRR